MITKFVIVRQIHPDPNGDSEQIHLLVPMSNNTRPYQGRRIHCRYSCLFYLLDSIPLCLSVDLHSNLPQPPKLLKAVNAKSACFDLYLCNLLSDSIQ